MECHRGTPVVRRGADGRSVSRISSEECNSSQASIPWVRPPSPGRHLPRGGLHRRRQSEEDVAELRARCAYPRPRGADPERTPICIWVSSTGFRQPDLLCAFRRRLVTVHVSPVSPSLTKEGNAACARQVCRKVTTRETRDQRRISTWYQNLRVLSAHPCGTKLAREDCAPVATANGWPRRLPARRPIRGQQLHARRLGLRAGVRHQAIIASEPHLLFWRLHGAELARQRFARQEGSRLLHSPPSDAIVVTSLAR